MHKLWVEEVSKKRWPWIPKAFTCQEAQSSRLWLIPNTCPEMRLDLLLEIQDLHTLLRRKQQHIQSWVVFCDAKQLWCYIFIERGIWVGGIHQIPCILGVATWHIPEISDHVGHWRHFVSIDSSSFFFKWQDAVPLDAPIDQRRVSKCVDSLQVLEGK